MIAAAALLDRAVGWRQGVVSRLQRTPLGKSDVDVLGYAAVPEPGTTGGTSGGVGFDEEAARLAAIAEALERHAATRCQLAPAPAGLARWALDDFTLHSPAQRAAADFPYPGYREPAYTTAWTLPDNEPVAVPTGLVGLHPRHGLPATSSGLAAAPSGPAALLRAAQELVERDALTVSWLHSLPGRPVALPAELAERVERLGGTVTAFDLTPAYSPHPVAAVAGTLPVNGVPRPTLGLACRASWSDAVAKAWLEWCQGTVFVGVTLATGAPTLAAHEVTDFDRHARYYAAHPDEWTSLPLFAAAEPRPAPPDSPAAGSHGELAELVTALHAAGVRLAYRDLTTPELTAVGLSAVRVLSPDLTPLHADHRWPHLGGSTTDLDRRYPGASGVFPSAHPHPLG